MDTELPHEVLVNKLKHSFIKDKVKADHIYAQHLYAALCNMRWQVAEVFPILSNTGIWSISWRGAGSLIAEMREDGSEFTQWYGSGMIPFFNGKRVDKEYVAEGFVTDEIKADMFEIGFVPNPWPHQQG